MSEHLDYCSIELSDEEEAQIVSYLSSLVYEATYETLRFPDCPMDWMCSTQEGMDKHVEEIRAGGGRISWIGPDSTIRERHTHRAFREEIRQRLIKKLRSERGL